ncbi:ATPase involved in Fe-S cluster formation SufC [Aeropyrum pernix K1]|uniref:ATPase involved in Fe-S cluster formation SufC n=1 Tax=Aeropyrum pernix (strain ATCC 700893 / DSM 11879 / JCM 9820 / NBRC 100138 / K1) TaxID=272557 RepID=Q9YB95_AERPE|nr:Fe-S cluster assembly ATPase SufC [Aeropyrum pernix]BAA80703.1 ATPase involved in Fe-S cluster formation SufC [Aeropyrum pernix K1]
MGLEVKGLTAKIGEKVVLNKVDFDLKYGEVHAVMGPNGSGKSSLGYVIMGREIYEVVEGDILLDGESIKELPPEERALKGIFMAQQDPPQIPGVRLSSLIIAFVNKRLGAQDLSKPADPKIVKRMYEYATKLGLDREILNREVNVGFSGGEKKRSELLQAMIFDPKIVILDEPDSGLDIDGLKIVAEFIKQLRDSGRGVMLITHYARLLNFVEPDRVTVLYRGSVLARGGAELARQVEEKGYAQLYRMLAKSR